MIRKQEEVKPPKDRGGEDPFPRNHNSGNDSKLSGNPEDFKKHRD